MITLLFLKQQLFKFNWKYCIKKTLNWLDFSPWSYFQSLNLDKLTNWRVHQRSLVFYPWNKIPFTNVLSCKVKCFRPWENVFVTSFILLYVHWHLQFIQFPAYPGSWILDILNYTWPVSVVIKKKFELISRRKIDFYVESRKKNVKWKKSKIKEKVRPSITFNIILKNIFNLKKLPKAREGKRKKTKKCIFSWCEKKSIRRLDGRTVG